MPTLMTTDAPSTAVDVASPGSSIETTIHTPQQNGRIEAITRGETISPVDSTFRLLGGTAEGAIGATGSWVVGLIGVVTFSLWFRKAYKHANILKASYEHSR